VATTSLSREPMHDVDLPGGDDGELVIDCDRVCELWGS
jgi:hypothetical protein